MTATRLQTGEGETFRLLSMPASKPGDLPEDRDGLLSAENGKNAIHPHHNSQSRLIAASVLRYVTASDANSEVAHLHPSLDGSWFLPTLPGVVYLGHGNDVLPLPSRRGG